MSWAQIKYFNALIDNKPFFDQPVKRKREVYVKLIGVSRNDDHTTGELLDYYQIYHASIGTDVSRQTNTSIPQQTNFAGNLEEGDGATMFFIAEKQQKTILNFSLDSLIIIE